VAPEDVSEESLSAAEDLGAGPAEMTEPEAPAEAFEPSTAPERAEREAPPSPPARRDDFQPAAPATVQAAIGEVNRVIDVLREALEDMEDVLDTLELAERQKDADEREIESLRRAVRQFQRPRESGHSHRGR